MVQHLEQLLQRIWQSLVFKMIWLKKKYNDFIWSIQRSNDDPYIARLEQFEDKNSQLKDQNDDYVEKITMLRSEIVELNNDIALLENELDELSPSIDEVNLLTYFKTKSESYTWKPGERILLRDSLEDFSEDTETQELYLNFMNTIGVRNYDNVDDLVYYTVRKVQDWVDDNDNYDFDKESFGASEWWLSPREAFNYYVTEEDEGDCEDLSALLYGCIITKLIENGFANERWRLKRVDVQILGSGGHALLAWLKDNLIWCPIETTFAKEYFVYNWRGEVDIFKSMYARLWHIFDEQSEYKLT